MSAFVILPLAATLTQSRPIDKELDCSQCLWPATANAKFACKYRESGRFSRKAAGEIPWYMDIAMSGSEPNRRILPFRPRGSLLVRPVSRPSPVEDLAKYERGPDEPGEYRHRMLMNGLAFGVTILLVIAGIWIADVMAQMRKNQDCVLMGRPGCTPVQAPPLQR